MTKFFRWYDDIQEPYRFLFFLVVMAIPLSGLMAFKPVIGAPLMLVLIGFRMLYLKNGKRNV